MTLYSAEIQYAATVYNFKGNDLILECNEQFMKTYSNRLQLALCRFQDVISNYIMCNQKILDQYKADYSSYCKI